MQDRDVLPEPWRSFFADLDELLPEPAEVHCFGGFAAVHAYGMARITNDVDFISSALYKKHPVHLDPVTIATCPDGYMSRLRCQK